MNDEQAPDPRSSLIVHRSSFHWTTVVLLAAILGGAVLRWVHLGRESLWFDEGYTAWVISLPPAQLIRAIRVDTAPPLYYLLLHGWAGLFGRSEAALRSMSAVFATVSLLMFPPLANRILRDRRAVAMATALFAVSFMQVAHAHEARFYTLVSLLAEADLLLVLAAIDRPAVWRYPVMILLWTINLYTNNMLGVYLAGLAVAWLLLPGARPTRLRLLDIVIVAIPVGLLFLPWVPTLLAQSASLKGRFWVTTPDRRLLYRTLVVLAGVNEEAVGWDWSRGMAAATIAVLGLTLLGFVRPCTFRRAAGLAVFGLLPIALIFLQSKLGQPVFMERAFIATSLVMPLLLVLPFARPGDVPEEGKSRQPAWLLPLVSIVWLVAGGFSLRLDYVGEHRESWREACGYADTGPRDRRLVVFVANEGETLYDYYERHGDYSAAADLTGVPASFFTKDPPQTMTRIHTDKDLDALRATVSAGNFDGVVLVESHFWFSDPLHRVRDELLKRMHLAEQRQFGDISVYRFTPGR